MRRRATDARLVMCSGPMHAAAKLPQTKKDEAASPSPVLIPSGVERGRKDVENREDMVCSGTEMSRDDWEE
jgi:hypothetical protein